MPIAKIEKLVFGGQALGVDQGTGKKVFLFNALPGEEVEYEITKKKKSLIEGIAKRIIKASPDRLNPEEKHFLSCSPWQIMPFDQENKWKQEIAQEQYYKIKDLPKEIEIVHDKDNQFHYRNKMEYSFFIDDESETHLAFFQRGKKYKSPIPHCNLAEKEINLTAAEILKWINANEIPRRSLKSLIIRSNNQGETIAALFIKDKLEFSEFPTLEDGNFKLPDHCQGFQLFYSTHKSPASVPTELMYETGNNYLNTSLSGVLLKFGLLSFFQVNISLFEKALEDISSFLPKDSDVIDFYSGVGAISLPLHASCKKLTLVESNEEAVSYCKENIALNSISNAEALLSPSEKMIELIGKDQILILDPPRAGVHHKLIEKVIEKSPKRIIYMSCNLSTHARDIELLQEKYELKFLKLYNFFPRTPHIESIAVLDLVN